MRLSEMENEVYSRDRKHNYGNRYDDLRTIKACKIITSAFTTAHISLQNR